MPVVILNNLAKSKGLAFLKATAKFSLTSAKPDLPFMCFLGYE